MNLCKRKTQILIAYLLVLLLKVCKKDYSIKNVLEKVKVMRIFKMKQQKISTDTSCCLNTSKTVIFKSHQLRLLPVSCGHYQTATIPVNSFNCYFTAICNELNKNKTAKPNNDYFSCILYF